jgi:hypothetical protein
MYCVTGLLAATAFTSISVTITIASVLIAIS